MEKEKKSTKSLQQFLETNGVDISTDPKKVEELKKAYYQSYHRAYYQERKEKKKRVELRFDKQEYRIVQQAAIRKKKPVATYLKEIVLAEVDEVYLTPSDENWNKVRYEINAIGNNINQIVYVIHGSKAYGSTSHYNDLLREVARLKKLVQTFVSESPNLYDALLDELKQNPKQIEKVQGIIKLALEQQNRKDDYQE